MNVFYTRAFKQSAKKLKKNQKIDLDKAVNEIIANVEKGTEKSGDLKGVKVHKFKMVGQLTLLAYKYEDNALTLTFLAFGSHENFYRDLKR